MDAIFSRGGGDSTYLQSHGSTIISFGVRHLEAEELPELESLLVHRETGMAVVGSALQEKGGAIDLSGLSLYFPK